jgi:hypothetical protein
MYTFIFIPFLYGSCVFISYVFMEKRKRVKFGWLLPIHNMTMAVSYMFTCTTSIIVMNKISRNSNFTGSVLPTITIYVYIFARFCEIFDSFVIILRKRKKQLIAYHVLRRSSACFSILLLTTFQTNSFYICAIDSFVRIFVYLYYSLCSIGIGFFLKRYKKYIQSLDIIGNASILIISQM